MAERYTRIGLSVFENRLKDGLNERVDKFVAHIREQYKLDQESKQALTAREWMEEFEAWAKNEDIRRLAEQFLLDNMPE